MLLTLYCTEGCHRLQAASHTLTNTHTRAHNKTAGPWGGWRGPTSFGLHARLVIPPLSPSTPRHLRVRRERWRGLGAPRIWACASVADEQSSPPEAGYRRQRREGLEGGWCDDAVLNHQVEGYKESVQHKHCAAVFVVGIQQTTVEIVSSVGRARPPHTGVTRPRTQASWSSSNG